MRQMASTAAGRVKNMFVSLARPPSEIAAPCVRVSRRKIMHAPARQNSSSAVSTNPAVTIGDITKDLHEPSRPEAVPIGYMQEGSMQQQSTLRHLRWMLQKDVLGQDMFLIGTPGAERRRLALQFCELTNRDVEYIALSRDTTEADLKQRREIRSGNTEYLDQCAVRAAIEGRVLVLEGIEKAERNVLPVLNNLLENREMQLEDGRFLVAPERYDGLLLEHSQQSLNESKFVRVDERFRIIALGLPVPRFPGNPLDPPLRSRFQARDISTTGYAALLDLLREAAPGISSTSPDTLERIASFASTLRQLSKDSEAFDLRTSQMIPEVPVSGLTTIVKLLEVMPSQDFGSLLPLVFPYKAMLPPQASQIVDTTLAKFDLVNPTKSLCPLPVLSRQDDSASIVFSPNTAPVNCIAGLNELGGSFKKGVVSTEYQDHTLHQMMVSHTTSDMCLIGARGVGKSLLVDCFAKKLGYSVQPVLLHKDMTARDLLQQRSTKPNGDTVWRLSPLVTAALNGSLAVLDGLHRVDSSTITVLQRLSQDRELVLHDGTHLMGHERYEECKQRYGLTDDAMSSRGIKRIHPSFRMIAMGDPLQEGGKPWLTEELSSMFHVHEIMPLSLEDNRQIIQARHPSLSTKVVNEIVNVASAAQSGSGDDVVAGTFDLSTRQLLRIAARLERFPDETSGEAISRACIAPFLPLLAKESLENVLNECGLSSEQDNSLYEVCTTVNKDDGRRYLDIGDVSRVILEPSETNQLLVPSILYYENPQHTAVMRNMLKDLALGEHLLLVGNQGVGKNKIVDRLLQLLNISREYIQLHRDTTVQTLTQQPSVEGGRIVYHDSPLVRAIQKGYVLVVDEADKAPTHVTCVLKSLVEASDMTLYDGRRIVPTDYVGQEDESTLIRMHPKFRMIVLANRPGFPFLGNDFYGSIGDVFSCHAVINPSMESELSMLAKYGPSVDPRVLKKLVLAFSELRRLTNEGIINYPFSIRELVSIVTHLESYPNESLGQVVRNVFDFDSYDKEMTETIVAALQKYGVPLGANAADVSLSSEVALPPISTVDQWSLDATQSVVCNVSIEALQVAAPVNIPVHQAPLRHQNARANKFTELEQIIHCPFHDEQRMLSTAIAENGDAFGMAMRPLQLFNFSVDEETNYAAQQILVADLQRFLPMYYGQLDLKVAALSSVLESTAAVFDRERLNVLITNFDEKTVQVISLGDPNNVSKNLSMCTELSSEGELVFFEKYGTRILVLDIPSKTVSSIEVPVSGISGIEIPSQEAWILKTVDGKLYGLSSTPDSYDNIPNELTELKTSLTTLPSAITNTTSDPTSSSRSLTSTTYYGGTAANLCDILVDGGVSQINVHARNMATKNSPDLLTYANSIDTFTAAYKTQDLDILKRDSDDDDDHVNCAQFEIIDLGRKTAREINLTTKKLVAPGKTWNGKQKFEAAELVGIASTANGKMISADSGGVFRVWETSTAALQSSLELWRQMIGVADGGRTGLEVKVSNTAGRKELERYSGLGNTAPKHGKEDPKNEPHVGGNQWAGGTGGRDTAGLGGKGGPYRLDKGHDVHQLSDEEKDAVPQHIKDAAAEMGKKAFDERLREIDMTPHDAEVYASIADPVKREVRELKVILSGLQARGDERLWIRNQSDGDLDDGKLIDGLTGDQTIYKRRGTQDPTPGGQQEHPKRLTFVVDVSGSMFRFNGHDGRLNRMLQAACLVMEAFEDTQPGKFVYNIVGHSGESHSIPFVKEGFPPSNDNERLKVLQKMYAHSGYCLSGDHTLEATASAIETLSKRDDADERYVIVLSDANLDRYGIHPRHLGNALVKENNTKAFCIMIGSLGDQATRLKENLPAGRGFVCMDMEELPKILKRIFTDVMLK
eukprot:m.239589 g.239589  ORF g.239589 m.239589 type:complete len:1870 (-) comp33748_c0_seq3:356-5965(-)